MRFDGSTNELCFRLYGEYSDNTLTLDIVNGIASVQMYNFYIDIFFEMLDYRIHNLN